MKKLMKGISNYLIEVVTESLQKQPREKREI